MNKTYFLCLVIDTPIVPSPPRRQPPLKPLVVEPLPDIPSASTSTTTAPRTHSPPIEIEIEVQTAPSDPSPSSSSSQRQLVISPHVRRENSTPQVEQASPPQPPVIIQPRRRRRHIPARLDIMRVNQADAEHLDSELLFMLKWQFNQIFKHIQGACIFEILRCFKEASTCL